MPVDQLPEAPQRAQDLRILLVRFGPVRDVLQTSAVARALHDRFPHARLTWAVGAFSAPLVQANPHIEDMIAIDWRAEWQHVVRTRDMTGFTRDARAFLREYRGRAFDVAIDFHGTPATALFTFLSRATHRIGPDSTDAFTHRCYTEHVQRPITPVRFTQPDVALLAPLGIAVAPERPVLVIPEEEEVAARARLAAKGWDGSPYIACCPATTQPARGWVWSRWGELADRLWQQEKLRTVFIGGPERRADILRLGEGHPSKPISMAGHANLLQSAALVQQAALVIGCDAGLTYAGLCTDTPTVVLHGPTEPGHLIEEPGAAVCFHPQACAPCRHPVCKHGECMAAITVEEVAEAARRLHHAHSPVPVEEVVHLA